MNNELYNLLEEKAPDGTIRDSLNFILDKIEAEEYMGGSARDLSDYISLYNVLNNILR